MMKTLLLNMIVVLPAILLAPSCDKIGYGEELISGFQSVDYNADETGTLQLVNYTNDSLLLYIKDELFRGIPPQTEEPFLIDVPYTEELLTLKLFKASGIENPFQLPDDILLFRRWDVVLSKLSGSPTVWVIENDESLASGLIMFSYPQYGFNQIPALYSVDVYLHSKAGTKIASLSPGIVDLQVGVPFGVHKMFYHYWWSDPNGASSPQQVGWIDKNTDGDEFIVILNATNQSLGVEIPVYYFSSIGKAGLCKITNSLNEPLIIYANNALIENFIIDDEPVVGMSNINPFASMNYLLKGGDYNIMCMNLDGEIVFSKNFCCITDMYTFNLEINPNQVFKQLTITNETQERLSLHDNTNGDYLGLWVEPGTTKVLEYPDYVSKVRAVNWFKTVEFVSDPLTLLSSWLIQ